MSEANLIAITIASLSPIATVIVAWLGGQHVKKIGADASATREQVENSHTTNLRNDIDKIANAVTDGLMKVHRRLDKTDDRVATLTNHFIDHVNRKE